MTNLLNIGRAGLASKNRPHFRAGGLYPNDMYHISFVVHVEPFVVHGTIPLFSPRREIDKEGTGGEQGQTQARFNKKIAIITKRPNSPYIIPPYSLSTAQHYTSTRASQVPISAVLHRRKRAIYGDFRGLEGTFLLSYVEPA